MTTKNYVFTHEGNLSAKGFIPINFDSIEFVKHLEKD